MITRRHIIVAAAVALAACAGLPARAGEVLTYDRVRSGVETGRVLLVDVREPDEFAGGHVPGAINLPLSSFRPAALPVPEGKSVVLMCHSGRRAGQALAMVEASGRHDVGLYAGSMLDWSAHHGALATGK